MKLFDLEITNQNPGEDETSDVLAEIFSMRIFKSDTCKEKKFYNLRALHVKEILLKMQ